ncbi:MAG: DUF58 domain-containing protein [Prevotella sp.]|nr:DUF58 domain-containing protein [Prevotella sp.]
MFLTCRFYIWSVVVILVVGGGFAWSPLFTAGQVLLCLLVMAVATDVALLWWGRRVSGDRRCGERFSNGDDNDVILHVRNDYPFRLWLQVIDEAPVDFQRRDLSFTLMLKPHTGRTVTYRLRPVRRGVYGFGRMRVFASTRVGLVQRRYTLGEPTDVKVYPSYQMLRQYELLAISNRLTEMGIKRIRRAGNNTEFEQIKDYVKGDDYRSINWKASARRHQLMVNVYSQERSQQVFCVIDKGRMMQQTFRGMTYLDYAINASLVLSFVALHKEDKAGIVTFNERFDNMVPAERRHGQMETIMESLYALQTSFGEADFSALVTHVNARVSQRSLLVLFTSFATMASMRRQLPYLQQLAGRHRVLVVYFEDTEISGYTHLSPDTTEEVYRHVIAEKAVYEQRLIASTLRLYGIMALYTTPENLSVDVINKYLEIKDRQ